MQTLGDLGLDFPTLSSEFFHSFICFKINLRDKESRGLRPSTSVAEHHTKFRETDYIYFFTFACIYCFETEAMRKVISVKKFNATFRRQRKCFHINLVGAADFFGRRQQRREEGKRKEGKTWEATQNGVEGKLTKSIKWLLHYAHSL